MNRQQDYKSITYLSFGEVVTELVPTPDFKDQHQVINAMLVAAHTGLSAWVVDNTTDPEPKNGKQEAIGAQIQDGQRKIADLRVSVPTTSHFSKAMFDSFLQQSIVPAIQQAVRSYPSSRSIQQSAAQSGKSPLAQDILPNALQQTSRVTPQQLQNR
ncbi:MAG: hypothetical protein JWS12_401 [Candidatus Saccharibacteria bacterium]|nr:hypothetical protein [Candidatus Saccharibacteria bacterium]